MNTPYGRKVLASLRPAIYVSRIYGMFSIGKRPAPLFQVFRCFLFCILVACLYHEIPTMRFWVNNVGSLHSILALLEISFRWSILIVNYGLNVLNNNNLNKCLDELLRLGIVIPAESMSWLFKFHIYLLIWNSLISFIFEVTGNLFIWDNENYHWYTTIIYVGTEFLIGSTLFIFIQLVVLIQLFFKELNNMLANIGRRHQEELISLFKTDDYRKGVRDVIWVRDAHLKLCSVSNKFNRCFSAQLLFLVSMSGVEVTYSLRSLVLYVGRSSDGGWWGKKPWMELLLTVFWLGYFSGGLFQLVASADMTSAESRRASQIAHQLINSHVSQDMEKELMIFSQQLQHHSAQFTAGSLISLTFTQISSIIGAIITYLVIIVTFKE